MLCLCIVPSDKIFVSRLREFRELQKFFKKTLKKVLTYGGGFDIILRHPTEGSTPDLEN